MNPFFASSKSRWSLNGSVFVRLLRNSIVYFEGSLPSGLKVREKQSPVVLKGIVGSLA